MVMLSHGKMAATSSVRLSCGRLTVSVRELTVWPTKRRSWVIRASNLLRESASVIRASGKPSQYLVEAEYACTHSLFFDVRRHVRIQVVVNMMTKAWGTALSCGVPSAAVDGIGDGLNKVNGNAGRRLSRHLDRGHVWFDPCQRGRLVPEVLGKLLARAGHWFPILRTSIVPEGLARAQEKGAKGLEAVHRHHVGVVLDMPKCPRDVIVDEVYLERRVGDAQVPNPDQDVIKGRCEGQGWFVMFARPIVDRARPCGRAEGAIEDDTGALGGVIGANDPVWRDVGVEEEL